MRRPAKKNTGVGACCRSVKWRALLPLAVLAVGIIAYANSFRGRFLMDDYAAIVSNPRIGSLTRMVTNTTRPLTNATFLLNHRLDGLNPAGYHVVNLGIHLVAGLALLGLVRLTLSYRSTIPRTHAAFLSFAVAAAWLVHPLQTQSVTYIVQRAESLMGMFYLLTLYCAARGMYAAEAGAPEQSAVLRPPPDRAYRLEACATALERGGPPPHSATINSGWVWYGLAAAACALGMLAKPVMVTAPPAVLLYDRAYVSGSFRSGLKARRGFYAALALTWVIVLILLTGPHESSHSAGVASSGLASPWLYLLTQAGVVLHYLKLVFVPTGVCFDYAWPVIGSWREALAPGFVVVLLLTASLLAYAGKNALGFPALFFFLALTPSSSLIPVADCAFDHRMYLPLAGITVVFVFAVYAFGRWLDSLRRGPWFICSMALVCCVVGGLTVLTIARNRDYWSEERMWADVLSKRPGNLRAREWMVDLMLRKGNSKGAEKAAADLLHTVESLEGVLDDRSFRYHYTMALDRMGRVLAGGGRFAAAMGYYAKAIAADRGNNVARCNLAVAQVLDGRLEEALRTCEEAIAMQPRYAKAHFVKGLVLRKMGRYADAAGSYREALVHDGGMLHAKYDLAWVLATSPVTELCDGAQAVALAEEVCASAGGRSVGGLDVLAAAYARAGRFTDAVETARRALELAEGRKPGLEYGLVDGLRKRLALYVEGRPFVDAPE